MRIFVILLSLCVSFAAFAEEKAPCKKGEFCWNELATTNVQAAKEFYGKVFGWEFFDHSMGDMTYTVVKMGEKEIAGIWPIPKDKEGVIQPHWLAFIMVDNLDDSLQKAQTNGATIVKPSTNVSDFGRFGIIKDPAGAIVALWQTLKMK